MCASHWARSKPKGAVKSKAGPRGPARERGRMGVPSTRRRPALPGRPVLLSRGGAHQERTRWDPKDGELCPARTKPGETLVEVRSDSDVQIDRQSWV